MTAFTLSVYRGYGEIVKMFLQHKDAIDFKIEKYGVSAFKCAIYAEKIEILKEPLKHDEIKKDIKPNENIITTDQTYDNKTTPLDYAKKYGNDRIIKIIEKVINVRGK